MIIVSQDRDLIINFDNVTVIGIAQNNSKEIDSITVDKEEQYLGEYKTEERAKEVLAEIYKKYSDWQSMRMIKNEDIQAKIVSGDNSKYFDIYIMPEE